MIEIGYLNVCYYLHCKAQDILCVRKIYNVSSVSIRVGMLFQLSVKPPLQNCEVFLNVRIMNL